MQTTEASSPVSPKQYNPSQSQYLTLPSAPPVESSNASQASAPPISQDELRQLENKVYDLNLDLITSELEYLNGQIIKIQNEINQMDTTKCDKQCQEANKIIESNTVDDILKKINDIFNK